MRNFLRICEGAAVMPLVSALALRPELWNQHTLRTTHPLTPHKQVDDIWLRFNPLPADEADVARVIDDVQCVNYPALAALPQARPLLFDLMRAVEGEQLGRCIITRMRPGARIDPHVDMGAPATFYKRFHITLQSLPGATFRAGDETVHMAMGEVWWFDNCQEHEVVNASADDRLTLIVDIRAGQ